MPNKIYPEVAFIKAIGEENTKILREQYDSLHKAQKPSWEYVAKEIDELFEYFKAGKLEITEINLKTQGIANFGYEITIKNENLKTGKEQKFMLKAPSAEYNKEYDKYDLPELKDM
jgi:hypothetical protein